MVHLKLTILEGGEQLIVDRPKVRLVAKHEDVVHIPDVRALVIVSELSVDASHCQLGQAVRDRQPLWDADLLGSPRLGV